MGGEGQALSVRGQAGFGVVALPDGYLLRWAAGSPDLPDGGGAPPAGPPIDPTVVGRPGGRCREAGLVGKCTLAPRLEIDDAEVHEGPARSAFERYVPAVVRERGPSLRVVATAGLVLRDRAGMCAGRISQPDGSRTQVGVGQGRAVRRPIRFLRVGDDETRLSAQCGDDPNVPPAGIAELGEGNLATIGRESRVGVQVPVVRDL